MKYHIYCQGQRITDRNSPMELSPTQVKHYEAAGYRLVEDKISDEAKRTHTEPKEKCACGDCTQFRMNMH